VAIHVALYHKTHYSYDKPVAHGPHVVRLRPAPHCRTHVLSYSQRITGGEHFLNWQQDPFSNWNARLLFPEPLKELCVEVELVAEMAVYNPFDFFLEDNATHFPFAYEASLKKELTPFLQACALTPSFTQYLAAWRPEDASPAAVKPLRTIDFLVALNQQLQRDLKYLIRLEPGVQSPQETLEKRSGSCRDSAWLLVQMLRHCGLAARFVSGYLIQLAPDLKSLDGPSGPLADFTDLHAWAEVYLPGAGWIGLDPTSGLLAGEGHLPLSCTPEPTTAAPVTGATDPCASKLHHEMRVTRIYESPRVTKPYTEEQWVRIDSLGHSIDAELNGLDARLTMGGEPTFVSIDDPDGPEWNVTAVSHKKRVLSGQLLKRLAARFAPGALLHYGQGKWYPGEQLPRWALAAYWRKDGVPVWKDPSLIADEARDYGFGVNDARALALRIASVLGVDPRFLLPGYEDAFYYIWKERRLPSNVTPENSNLKDELERDRIARIFQKGLGEIVGYALPLRRVCTNRGPMWNSGPWFLRDGDTLWLIPGDSPMGLRLPLDSIPWVAHKDYPWLKPPDPTQRFADLPTGFPYAAKSIVPRQPFLPGDDEPSPADFGPGQRAQKLESSAPDHSRDEPASELNPYRRPLPGESAAWIVRTALCVEPRDGRLHVFMPPSAATEDYLDLLAGIETAAADVGLPVIIEGDPPPKDPRLSKLAVTPDPGVIEVNLHPSNSWHELVERTTILYEEARQTRLGTEKFMLDGRHTGTGGGNHIIIGGETPNDSPLLRRPDLLRSLLAYWQNHPSLSWLFSNLFIGPTSQAPRVDEARHDSLHELELAFGELDRHLQGATAPPPWLADRLFRNLLIDASGNTHRAEFCVDKLFAPERVNARLGLAELRAFEMPPHARMSLAQHLLLRGLIAKFWRQPYRNQLVRWGTDIHDRWMLPHFCETDFRDVLHDLCAAGFPFQFDWFAPHFEFRFPQIGELAQRDLHLGLRTALEPWHVLGEQPGAGGTVRYVDSSLERLQVKARGLVGDRFLVTVNGHRVPLHPTGTNGEGVAGVRYRAWQPAECLQPTIGVHTPLTFDLYDTWNQRSLGGCTYHVTHPGGRNYETFPVNSYEAESRRLARFFTHGATQGTFIPGPESSSGEFPFTLDLRKVSPGREAFAGLQHH
jgi:uncharacterized protein (DUF2126 family)/transglutaminase-like putative cysteine protease